MNKREILRQLDGLRKRIATEVGPPKTQITDQELAKVDQSLLDLIFMLGRKYLNITDGKVYITRSCPAQWRDRALESMDFGNPFMKRLEDVKSVEDLLRTMRRLHDLGSEFGTMDEIRRVLKENGVDTDEQEERLETA